MITHLKDRDTNKVIIFVHGIGGAQSTWSKFASYIEIKWDFEFGILLEYFYYYKNILNFHKKLNNMLPKIFRIILAPVIWVINVVIFLLKLFWSKRNSHNVNLLENYIETNCRDANYIILIAHSMGGLIARQLLINYRKENKDISRFKLLITYATPHKGSYIANGFAIKNFKALNNIYIKVSSYLDYRLSPQLGDLVTLGEFIKNIDENWTVFDLERKITFLRVVAKKDNLVKRDSAMLHDRDIENIFEFDYSHSGIIRPVKSAENFAPIDIFFDALKKIDFDEENLVDEETDINYDSGSEDINSY